MPIYGTSQFAFLHEHDFSLSCKKSKCCEMPLWWISLNSHNIMSCVISSHCLAYFIYHAVARSQKYIVTSDVKFEININDTNRPLHTHTHTHMHTHTTHTHTCTHTTRIMGQKPTMRHRIQSIAKWLSLND